MRKLGDLSTRDVPGIARTVTRDIGQVISQTGRQLVPRAADNFHYFAEMRTRTDGHTHPTPTHLNDTLFHPVGVCALISPWNLPFMTATWKAAPCLAFGKSAVLKLSELSPPPRSLRWLPPLGAQAPLGAARRGVMMPPRSLRSLPPLGVQAPLGAARREA